MKQKIPKAIDTVKTWIKRYCKKGEVLTFMETSNSCFLCKDSIENTLQYSYKKPKKIK